MFTAKDAGFMDVNIKTIGRADTQETEANNLETACANYSATRGLTGTALPAAAADAAGGVPISDAGGLDLDAMNTNVSAILSDTGTDGVKLANDAITSAKFDETTAFPVKSADTGATQIARVGADGDTLETLSDQLDTITTDTNELQTDLTDGGRLDLILDAILADTNELQTDDYPTSIAAVKADTAAILTDTGTDGVAVSATAITAIWAKAMSDLAAGAPSATCSVLAAINYLYEAWRNKTETTSSEIAVYKDDGSTKLCESDISDDGTTFTKGEYGAAD